ALDILAQTEHITPEIASGLNQAYAFLRNLEHRLQMREDCQTQTIPDQDEAVAAIALLMNEKNINHFLETIRAHLLFVHNAYAELFETPEPTSPVPGSLVFTGVEDDPRTIETLTSFGFADPSIISSRIRRWHQAGLRATRSVRARELLTDLVPRILTKLSELDDPQGAFTALDAFLTALPGGFQAFALFTAHPEVLDDILVLCQSSPELAAKMAQRPSLIEGLLEGSDISPPDFPAPQPDDILEDRLDTVRRVVNEHRIRVGASLALGRADPHKVSLALSNTADRAIKDLIEAVRADIETPPEGDLAVLGFGRLGVRGLTPLSDLDLVFVYDPPNGQMDHEKGFTRLIRRIVNALSVPTTEGPLYEIDMKLRPSGGAGPTVVSLPAFYQYYQ
ncbi:MAG: glutamine-synthetase adenylyltransferase, partial [Pseudomonadota bacterium]